MKKIYLKIKQNCSLPVARLSYTYKDFEGVIHPFGDICVDFKEDEKNIKTMESIKNKYGSFFMFFNHSDEGMKFWRENPFINIASK